MRKDIKGYKIWIEGTWCEVTTKDGEFIYEGSISEDMTHEDVYRYINAKIVYRLNGKFLLGYNAIHEAFGEREAIKEQLAYENNCDIKDITVEKEIESLESILWDMIVEGDNSLETNNLYWKLKGLEIRKEKDCWGCEVYFGYKDGKQYTDYFDVVSELKEQYPIFNLIEVM